MLDFAPAEAAQVNFGKGPDIIDAFSSGHEIKTWVFVMALCFSRHMYAEIIIDQKVPTWLACHRKAFEFFNGIPQILISFPLLKYNIIFSVAHKRIRIRFLKTDQQKNRVVWPLEMSHNILYCNDAAASPKRLQTTKIQIPDEDRIVKKAFCCKLSNNT
ncbi:MAG TPA: hypothetical protein ENI07_18770 [Desulfobacterales bacterium]|nr:hypothetical protein [Desulfobacterales bacterium]